MTQLTERYKLMVRRDNDLRNQLDIQAKLIVQIEEKLDEANDVRKLVDPSCVDYSFMGRL